MDSPRVDYNNSFETVHSVALKELGEPETASLFRPIRKQLAEETSLLFLSTSGQIEEDRIESVRVDAVWIPHGVEIARFVLRSDEAPIQPHPPTPCFSEEREGLTGPSSWRRRVAFQPNRSSTSSHDAACSPVGKTPVSGSNDGIGTPQL